MKTHDTRMEEELGKLAASAGCRLAILFGSSAAGQERARDVDVALAFDELPEPARRLELLADVQEITHPRPADVVFLHRDTSPVLRFEVFRQGRPVFEAEPGLFVRGAVRALALYEDARPFRNALVRQLAAEVRS
jgi:predicted nucleotidyltransferase